MSTKNKPSFLLTWGITTLLIVGGAVAYWVLVQRKPMVATMPVGVNLIPQDALMTFSVSTNPDQWQRLREFGTAQTQAAFDQTLVELRDRFLTPLGYNYQRDIQPWIGKEATFAFLYAQPIPPVANPVQYFSPPPKPSLVSSQQSAIILLPIDKPLQAKQMIEQPNSPFHQGKWVERNYKGIQIRETTLAGNKNYSTTVLDQRFLVITTDPKATDRVIDTYQGGKSLATTPGYSQALSKIEANQPYGKLYINIPVAAAAARNSQRPLSPQGFTQLQQQQGLVTNIFLESEGIRFKGISWLKPNSQKKYIVQNNGGNMAKRLPANTIMMLSGSNLKQFWQEYVQGAEANPITPIKPEELRNGIKSATNLDLDRDLISWMNGEFSLSLLPVPQKDSANLGVGLVFMVQTSDRNTAEKTLAQLDQVLSNKYRFKLEPSKIDRQTVVKWKTALGDTVASQGWLDSNIAFLTVGASPIVNTILPKPPSTLVASEAFQKAIPTEPNPINGQFFLDVDRSLNVNLFPQLPLPVGTTAITQGMRTIGVTTAISDERSTRFDIFVGLKKGTPPKALPKS